MDSSVGAPSSYTRQPCQAQISTPQLVKQKKSSAPVTVAYASRRAGEPAGARRLPTALLPPTIRDRPVPLAIAAHSECALVVRHAAAQLGRLQSSASNSRLNSHFVAASTAPSAKLRPTNHQLKQQSLSTLQPTRYTAAGPVTGFGRRVLGTGYRHETDSTVVPSQYW